MITSLKNWKIFEDIQKDIFKIGSINKDIKIHVDIEHGLHSIERQRRHDNIENFISDREIKELVDRSTESIVDSLISDKINIGDRILVTDKTSNLNVVGSINLRKDDLVFKVITVMKEKDFRNKMNTYRIYV